MRGVDLGMVWEDGIGLLHSLYDSAAVLLDTIFQAARFEQLYDERCLVVAGAYD